MKEACGKTSFCPGCGELMLITDMKIGVCGDCKRQADENRSHLGSTFSNEDLFGES